LQNVILFWYLQKKNPKNDIVKVPKEARLPLMLRGMFGFGGNIFAVTALKLIPLAKATVIINTNPIFIGIFGVLLLKEQISGFDIAGIFVTFSGVVIFLLDSF
jgi:drug/metabolite transporter (DMT)-like permease